MIQAKCLRGMYSTPLVCTPIHQPIRNTLFLYRYLVKITFNLNGKPFTINKKGHGKKIISIAYGNQPVKGYFITHQQLQEGKKLVITTE